MSAPDLVKIQEVLDFLPQNPKGILLDVLPPAIHQKRHLPGAKQACVFETVFPDQVLAMAPDLNTPILVYGAGKSLDAGVAAAKLLSLGYTRVKLFSGGLEAWREANLPLEGTDPQGRDEPYPPQVPQYQRYRLLPAESRLNWIGRNDAKSHNGGVALKSGWLNYENGKCSAEVVVDMTSISSHDLAGTAEMPFLLAHLASPDFFGTAQYPEAIMRILSLEPASDTHGALPDYRAIAQFVIRGHEQVLEGSVALANLPEGKLALAAQGDLDRTQFGALYGSARFFRFLGMHKVNDLINLDAQLIFQA